ncbi:hypothetical protein OG474_30185 [Kribbella sp. NBC_01505]|uniref:hypothetical protein n=1 Tax=Kribbella sp. NBC_01505 TaxID=2903580 RepID=UPI00386C20DA
MTDTRSIHRYQAADRWILKDPAGRQIGEVIHTPSGLMVWAHDYEGDDATTEFLPLYLDIADDFAGALRKVDDHEATWQAFNGGSAP